MDSKQLADLRADYWRSRSINKREGLHNADALWDWLAQKKHEQVTGWPLESGLSLFFRGQADIGYGLTTSLYRAIRDAKGDKAVTEEDMKEVERRMLVAMRSEGIGRHMNDGQLLTVLQHHLMPTRLLDVSRAPFESLFFACESNHGGDGVLFLINPHDSRPLKIGARDLPWLGHAKGKYANSSWTNAVHHAENQDLDPRMVAQRGTFLVGGLHRSYATALKDSKRRVIPVEVRPDVMNFAVNFLVARRQTQSTYWNATGWVIAVKAEWKRPLLDRLHGLSIKQDTIYPPIDESSRLARYVVRAAAGELAQR